MGMKNVAYICGTKEMNGKLILRWTSVFPYHLGRCLEYTKPRCPQVDQLQGQDFSLILKQYSKPHRKSSLHPITLGFSIFFLGPKKTTRPSWVNLSISPGCLLPHLGSHFRARLSQLYPHLWMSARLFIAQRPAKTELGLPTRVY